MNESPTVPEISAAPPDVDDLDAVWADVWQRLAAGVGAARHPFHLAALATIDREGCPDLRTVVLRGATPDTPAIFCHTDIRSPKVDQLRAHPDAAWLFYDDHRKIQVRLAGPVTVLHEGDFAEVRWAATRPGSRRCYLAPMAPGTPTPDASPNLASTESERSPSPDQPEAGRARFTVLWGRVSRIDWLHVRGRGHRRARFRIGPDGRVGKTWIAP